MLLRRLLAVCGLTVLLAGSVQAQEPDTSGVVFRVQMPDSVVVTASRVASVAKKTGRRVSVYTQQDIQDLSVNSVDQLLDVVGGLDVQSRGGFGVQGLWKDRLKDDGLATDRYGVIHTRLAYRTRLGDSRVTLSSELRNAFDRQYSEIFDAPMPGRTLLVGATVQL